MCTNELTTKTAPSDEELERMAILLTNEDSAEVIFDYLREVRDRSLTASKVRP